MDIMINQDASQTVDLSPHNNGGRRVEFSNLAMEVVGLIWHVYTDDRRS